MRLSPEQLQHFERDGYLFFPSLFKPEEIKVLLDEVPRLYAQHRPENVREKGSDAVRTNFAAHMYSTPFAKLARHPRMIEPIMLIFGEELYMHQFKINGKLAFDGDLWQWHQDYGTWKNDDLMPASRAMNVAIFLDEVNEFNGPLMFIPGSHTLGVIDAEHAVSTTSYPLWTIDHDPIRKLVRPGGLLDRPPHPRGRGRHVDVRDTQGGQRIQDGVDDGARRADRAALASALDAERIRRTRHVATGHGDRGKIVGARDGIVQERTGEQ